MLFLWLFMNDSIDIISIVLSILLIFSPRKLSITRQYYPGSRSPKEDLQREEGDI